MCWVLEGILKIVIFGVYIGLIGLISYWWFHWWSNKKGFFAYMNKMGWQSYLKLEKKRGKKGSVDPGEIWHYRALWLSYGFFLAVGVALIFLGIQELRIRTSSKLLEILFLWYIGYYVVFLFSIEVYCKLYEKIKYLMKK